MESAKQLELLKKRIVYQENVFEDYNQYEDILNRLLEDSKNLALSLRFPYQDYSSMELPKKYYNWQLRCCEELYRNLGTQGIKSYSENGLAWTRDSSYITHELESEIEPIIGYIMSNKEKNCCRCGSDSNV